jgi:acyl-homoserine-lactone acylase
VNTTYADEQGNAFYIDSSSVPYLSPIALSVIAAKRAGQPVPTTRCSTQGLTLLDGDNIRDDWVVGQLRHRPDALCAEAEAGPQRLRAELERQLLVDQHRCQPLEGFSPLYGPERSALNPRTRIGTDHAAEPDRSRLRRRRARRPGRIVRRRRAVPRDRQQPQLVRRGISRRAARALHGGGRHRDQPRLAAARRSVASACAVLADWDGVYDLDSVGAHVFRVFIVDYRSKFGTHLTEPFDPADPVGTPGVPAPLDAGDVANDPMLVSLAAGLERLDLGGIEYDARLGDVQYFQPSGGAPPGGAPMDLGPSFPWHGGDGTLDGAFNAIGVVNQNTAEDTLLPRVNPPQISTTAGLSATPGQGWRMARGTSWHFGLEFTDQGPRGFGLVSYSQSVDPDSPFFNDQNARYSDKNFRPLLFTEAEIAANVLPGGEITISDD